MIDTHTHVIAEDLTRYPLDVEPRLLPSWVHEHPVPVGGLLAAMDGAGVGGAVLVQARGAYGFDNSYVADARAADPRRLVNAAVVDVAASDRGAQLHYWTRERGVLGLRLFDIPPADPGWYDTADTRHLVTAAAAAGVRVSVCVLAGGLPATGRLLAACPGVVVSLDHCGFPRLDPHLSSPDLEALAGLSGHANLRLKVTTTLLARAAGAGLPPAELLGWLARTFGAERLMWGSDYPQHHAAPYGELVAATRAACTRLGSREQALFFGGTAAQVWPELAAHA